jgi:hypothetical protein
MGTIKIPCNVGEVFDGYHTFNELYEHRNTLMLSLMKAHPEISWISAKTCTGEDLGDWFLAGMRLPTGDTSYHLPMSMWVLACRTQAKHLEFAPVWDGHTSKDVVDRLQNYIGSK